MKKRLLALCLAAALTAALSACAQEKKTEDAAGTPETTKEEAEETEEETLPEAEKVILNEVAHSIFYAPMYVAVEEGYFEAEGIDLELVTGFGVRILVQDKS